jgi:hypothetical protein
VANPTIANKQSVLAPEQLLQQTGQSVRAAIVSSQPLGNMLLVVTVVQQIMTEFGGAVSEESNRVYYQNCITSHETKWPL